MASDYPTMISPDRYELRNGKWGAYFYDNERNIDMPLDEVLNTLNRYSLRKEQLTWFVTKYGDPQTELENS